MSSAYDADLYQLLHRGNPGDLAWYMDQCSGAERILELGSGTGRILCPLAAQGHRLVGLEHDAAMLELCRQRLVDQDLDADLICGDMRGFALPGRFDRVLIPYNSLYCLLTEADQLSCLSQARAHLAPDGLLLLDVYAADPLPEETPETHEVQAHPVAQFHDGMRRIEVVERSVEEPRAQLIRATYEYHITWDDGRVERRAWTIPQRYLFPTQLLSLLAQAGLALVGLFGDFSGGDFTESSLHMVVVAQAVQPEPEVRP